MIRVLVAEDSATMRELLVQILESDPELKVVGQARNGLEAVELTLRLRPQIVTMDINMPLMDGFEATKRIMMEAPTPIIIVSSRANHEEVELSLNATRAGALMLLPTPENPRSAGFQRGAEQLVRMTKAMAGVKVVRQRLFSPQRQPLPSLSPRKLAGRSVQMVAVASSTGGPAVLQRALEQLPAAFPVPILVVQHIAAGFTEGLCAWLNGSSRLSVRMAVDGETILPGTVYVAPENRHLGVTVDRRVLLSAAPPIGGFRPSGNFLFESAAEVHGAAVVAVILTGMGRDGVEGLGRIHEAGGIVIAQDEASSIVWGMPGEAVLAGVVDFVVPASEIGPRLVQITSGATS